MAKSLRTFFEIYPADPRGTTPIGMRVNDVVYANGLAGVDLVTGEPAEDVTSQMSLILGAPALADGAGRRRPRRRGALRRVRDQHEDRETIYGPWEALYPDPADRPALKALLAELPEGHLCTSTSSGSSAASGRASTSPTSTHETPASVPATSTSRRAATPMTRPRAARRGRVSKPRRGRRWRTSPTLVGLSGGSEANIVQLNMFGRDDSYKETARRVFEERSRTRPRGRRCTSS